VVLNTDVNAGIFNLYQWRTNSVYDPDYTNVGHQPYFRDQIAPLYRYYLVLGAKFRLKLINNTTGGIVLLAVTISPTGDAPPTGYDYLCEIPYTKRLTLNGSQSKPTFYNRYVDNAATITVPKQAYITDAAYLTSTGTNPAILTTYNLSYATPFNGAVAFMVNLQIDYWVVYSSQIIQAQS